MSEPLRRARAESLIITLDLCHPSDAAQITAAWLEENLTGGPIPTFFDLPGEARIWSAASTPPELEAYLGAILNEIKRTAFHSKALKRLFVQLWHGLTEPDRRNFLTRFAPEVAYER